MNIAMLRRQSASITERLQQQFKDQMSGGRQDDPRFWKPSPDKAGNAYAVLRFLPPPMDPDSETGVEDSAYVKVLSYGFQGPGGWYIENSPKTIGQDDPVAELNSAAYNTKLESEIEKAKKRKMRTHFISNVLVIEDSANPSNNGKVFLYKYGKKIFEKINDKLFPSFPGEQKMDAFNLWEGANFKLKMREVEGFPNYDKSEFDNPSALMGGDEGKLEVVWKQAYSLKAFLDPSNFKSYDELSKKMDKVLNGTPRRQDSRGESGDDAGREPTRHVEEKKETAPRDSSPPAENRSSKPSTDEEDEMEFFRRIAAGK